MNDLIGGSRNDTQQGIGINPDDLEEVKCSNCSGVIFEQKVMLFRLSALLSPNGEEAFIPQPVLVCNQCGTVFNPK